jgi:hypothetical protein
MSSLKMRCACLAFLTLVVLACTMAPQKVEVRVPNSTMGNLSVDRDPNSTGPVHVALTYSRGKEPTVTLLCTYPGEDGNPRQYSHVDNNPITDQYEDLVGVYRHDSFDFVLKKPGTYQVTCQLDGSAKSASFTIEAPAAGNSPEKSAKKPSAEQPASSTNPVSNTVGGESQMPALGHLTSGRMWFEFARATSRGPNFHLLQGCLPGLQLADTAVSHYGDTHLKVASDGALSGECTASLTTADGTLQTTSQLTQGQWTEDGKLTYRLETSVVLNVKDGTANSNLVWIGTGHFISPTTASGTATWEGTCQGTAGCSYAQDNGTIPWVIDLYP